MKCHPRISRRSFRLRRGLTILETMIAIGVAIIGLFGVWALIPIAGQKTERALLEDNKSTLGRRAFRDFDVRGMRQRENWLVPRSAYFGPPSTEKGMRHFYEDTIRANWIPAPDAGVDPQRDFSPVDLSALTGHSICIDPLTFADAMAQGQSVNTDLRWFPALEVNKVDPTIR